MDPDDQEQVHRLLLGLTVRDFLLGVAVLVGGVLVAVLIRVGLKRVLRRYGLSTGVTFSLAKLTSYAIGFIFFLLALTAMGVNITAVLAASSALLLGVGLGLQTSVQNFVAGVIVLIERPVQRGDFIRFEEVEGTVEDVGLRASRLLTRDGSTVVVPNQVLVSQLVTNYSYPVRRRRISVHIELSHDCGVEEVVRTLQGVAGDCQRVLRDPEPEVRLTELASSGFVFELRAWVSDPVQSRRIASELRYAVVSAFRQRGIAFSIPELELRLPAESSAH